MTVLVLDRATTVISYKDHKNVFTSVPMIKPQGDLIGFYYSQNKDSMQKKVGKR
jgi:hypothetical protein